MGGVLAQPPLKGRISTTALDVLGDGCAYGLSHTDAINGGDHLQQLALIFG